MNTQQLQYVLTLAKEKSFSAAADKLFITQPSLSQYINKLETGLGIKIFDRTTKPLSLTDAGKLYVATAEKMLTLEKDLMKHLDEYKNLQTGELTIGASTYHSSYLLPKSIAAYHTSYPGIHISMYEDETEELFVKLRNGSLDLVITTTDIMPLEFDLELLAQERIYLAIPVSFEINDKLKGSRLSEHDIRYKTKRFLFSKPVDLCSLAAYPFVLTGRSRHEALYSAFLPISQILQDDRTIFVRTAGAAFAYTLANVGISLIPDSLIRYGNFEKHPYYYPLPEAMSTVSICMYMRKQASLPMSIKSYGQVLKDLIAIGTWRI